MNLPVDAKARKDIPIYSGFLKYFPKTAAAVAKLSVIGNEQHNPGEPLHWAREKSTDQHDTLIRHAMEAGSLDSDRVPHDVKVAWRAAAACELYLEENPWDESVESILKFITEQKSQTPVFDEYRRARVCVLEQGFEPAVVYIHPQTYCDLRNEIEARVWHGFAAYGVPDRLMGFRIYQNDQIAPGVFYFATGPIDHG